MTHNSDKHVNPKHHGARGDGKSNKITVQDIAAHHTGTPWLLLDVAKGTLQRVTIGAANSAGKGYRILRVPN